MRRIEVYAQGGYIAAGLIVWTMIRPEVAQGTSVLLGLYYLCLRWSRILDPDGSPDGRRIYPCLVQEALAEVDRSTWAVIGSCRRAMARTFSRMVQSIVVFFRTASTNSRAMVRSVSSRRTLTALSFASSAS
jgi:hypothetical protein